MEIKMLVKLKEAQKIDSAQLDEHGRMTAKSSFVFRDILVNPEHIVSINEEDGRGSERLSRIETTRGVFTVVGSPVEVQELLSLNKTKKVLRD
jgi:hypothetical protein